MTSEGVLKRKRQNLDLCNTSQLISPFVTWEGPRSPAWHVIIDHLSWELLQQHEKPSISPRVYCIFENWVFRAPQQQHFHECTTLYTKHQLLHIRAIFTTRNCHFANQLRGIAEICKSKRLEQSVLHFWKSFWGDALNTQLSKMQYPRSEMLGFSCVCNSSQLKLPILTCQAWLRGPSHVKNGDIS